MKAILRITLLLFIPFLAHAQNDNSYPDGLKTALKNAPNDTVRMVTLLQLADYYVENERDTALYYAEQGLNIAKKMKQPIWEAQFLLTQAYLYQKQYNLVLCFKLTNEALAIAQDEQKEKNVFIPKKDIVTETPHLYRMGVVTWAYHQLGNIYSNAKNNEKAIEYWKKEIEISKSLINKIGLVTSNMNIGSTYVKLNQLDSALLYSKRALHYANLTGYKTYDGNILGDIGEVYFKENRLDSAKQYFWNALKASKIQNNLVDEIDSKIYLSELYYKIMQSDSAKIYAESALLLAEQLKQPSQISEAANLLSKTWEMMGESDSAYAWLRVSKTLSDSVNTAKNLKLIEFQNISFGEQMRIEKEAQESAAIANRFRLIALMVGAGLLAILALVFYRNNRQKQKANVVLESTLVDLKSTQSQLIQSEKMASLGELTAGIAHEIQNPLNFVNNFSEVSNELLIELKEELDKGDIDEAKAISDDVIQNLEKINHHGKRADAIVKGMLAHSRTSTGEKVPTDINALADEYLRLSYHGLRAKDKNFNADFKTDFDPNLPKIEVIPQDIGRVLLNLINNAFQACAERSRSACAERLALSEAEVSRSACAERLALSEAEVSRSAVNEKSKTAGSDYVPKVTVSTKLIFTPSGGSRGAITVSDNGNGIPDAIKDKIFQPFFTTKPTGQGTGLGLSLAYDIVKANGGELKVETKEGEGSEFIIQLPIS